MPTEGLPRVSHIVASELPIALVGFWNDPKERAEFEKRRAEEIARHMANSNEGSAVVGGALVDCFLSLGPLFCPLLLPVIVPAAAVTGQVQERVNAGRSVASIPISEKNGRRLAALFSETLTGAALGERTLALVPAAPTPSGTDGGFPRLALTVKSATVRQDGEHVTVVAQAQAHPSSGVAWAPTEHVIDMELWQRYDYTVAVQKILDVLAHSIVETYLPQHPYSVEKRHWGDVRTKDAAQVQTYLERYPGGAFAELARGRMAELAAQDAAARKSAARAAAAEPAERAVAAAKAKAKSFFRESARVRPELEGRWSGSAPVPYCGRTSYTLLIKDGHVEGTVEWQLSVRVRTEVVGYVREDGVVSAVPISSGRVDRSQSLYLVPESGRLTGPSTIACTGRHLVTLGRG